MRKVNSSRVVLLDENQRSQLEAFARSRSLPHVLVVRAKIVLEAAEGKQSGQIAEQIGVNRKAPLQGFPYQMDRVHQTRFLCKALAG